jgi:hypothetical protein
VPYCYTPANEITHFLLQVMVVPPIAPAVTPAGPGAAVPSHPYLLHSSILPLCCCKLVLRLLCRPDPASLQLGRCLCAHTRWWHTAGHHQQQARHAESRQLCLVPVSVRASTGTTSKQVLAHVAASAQLLGEMHLVRLGPLDCCSGWPAVRRLLHEPVAMAHIHCAAEYAACCSILWRPALSHSNQV